MRFEIKNGRFGVLRFEIRNWRFDGKMGKWTLDLSDLGWVIDLSLNIMTMS